MRTIIAVVIVAILFGLFVVSCSASINKPSRISRVMIFADDPALTLLEVRQPTLNAVNILKDAKSLYTRGLHSKSGAKCEEAEKILERVQGKIFALSGQQARLQQDRIKNLILESQRCAWEE